MSFGIGRGFAEVQILKIVADKNVKSFSLEK